MKQNDTIVNRETEEHNETLVSRETDAKKWRGI
jgi:hypothetical protein